MRTTSSVANSQLARDCAIWGLSPLPGVNAFGMVAIKKEPTARDLALESRRVSSKAKRERQSKLTKAQISALAMRSPEERAADRAKAHQARKDAITEMAKPSRFNTPIYKSVLLGTSAKARARAAI